MPNRYNSPVPAPNRA